MASTNIDRLHGITEYSIWMRTKVVEVQPLHVAAHENGQDFQTLMSRSTHHNEAACLEVGPSLTQFSKCPTLAVLMGSQTPEAWLHHLSFVTSQGRQCFIGRPPPHATHSTILP